MKIVELRCADLAKAVTFIIHEIKIFRGEDVSFDNLYKIYFWLFVDNPLRREDFIGWGLVDAEGELRGTHLICWEDYSKGQQHIRILVSTNSYVQEAFRGPIGLGLMLNMRKRVGVDVCICTTANVNSGSIWKSLKANVLSRSDAETIIGMNPQGLICERFASSSKSSLIRNFYRIVSPLRRLMRRKISSDYNCCQILETELNSIATPLNVDRFEPHRNSEYLQWRYFLHPSSNTMLYRVADGQGNDCYVGICLRKRGKLGLTCAYLLDLFGDYQTMHFESILGAIDKATHNAADFFSLRLHLFEKFTPEKHWLSKTREMEFPTHWGLSLNKDISITDCSLMMCSGDAVV
jgi:hypothetical protein